MKTHWTDPARPLTAPRAAAARSWAWRRWIGRLREIGREIGAEMFRSEPAPLKNPARALVAQLKGKPGSGPSLATGDLVGPDAAPSSPPAAAASAPIDATALRRDLDRAQVEMTSIQGSFARREDQLVAQIEELRGQCNRLRLQAEIAQRRVTELETELERQGMSAAGAGKRLSADGRG